MSENVVASPVINPAPLGLFAFGMTTCALSAINAGMLPAGAMPILIPMALCSGGVTQIIAGLFEFRQGATFGGTAFVSYGFFWVWFALVQWTVGSGWLKIPSNGGQVTGAILVLWGIFSLLLWIVSLRQSKALCLLLALLVITIFLLAPGDFGHPLGHAGGYFGLATGGLAVLMGFAELLNTVAGRVVISLGKPILAD